MSVRADFKALETCIEAEGFDSRLPAEAARPGYGVRPESWILPGLVGWTRAADLLLSGASCWPMVGVRPPLLRRGRIDC